MIRKFFDKLTINTHNQKRLIKTGGPSMALMIYLLYYVVAISALFLHFTGHLERWGMDWLILVLAVTVFPVVIYL